MRRTTDPDAARHRRRAARRIAKIRREQNRRVSRETRLDALAGEWISLADSQRIPTTVVAHALAAVSHYAERAARLPYAFEHQSCMATGYRSDPFERNLDNVECPLSRAFAWEAFAKELLADEERVAQRQAAQKRAHKWRALVNRVGLE